MKTRNAHAELETLVALALVLLDAQYKTYQQLATETQLSISTIYRLYNNKFSTHVEFRTVQKLAHAAGLSVQFTDKSGIVVGLHKKAA